MSTSTVQPMRKAQPTQATPAATVGFNARTNGLLVYSGLRAGAADGNNNFLTQLQNWCQSLVGGATSAETKSAITSPDA